VGGKGAGRLEKSRTHSIPIDLHQQKEKKLPFFKNKFSFNFLLSMNYYSKQIERKIPIKTLLFFFH